MAISYVTIVLATTMSFLVLSAIAEEFDVSLRAVGWVVIVEALIVSALVLPLGAMADALGRRRVMLAGMSIFALGSLFTGLAPSFALLIAARVVMALGNALVQSIGTGILVAAFPAEERGLALGAQTSAVAVGSAAGPLLGGFALEVVSWDGLFLLLVVPSLLGVGAIAKLIPADVAVDPDDRSPIDHLGGLLAALAITGLVVTINNPFAFDWLSLPTFGFALATTLVLAAFVTWELRSPEPMLDLRLFGISAFRHASLVRVFGFIGSTAPLLLMPIYLLSLREISESTVGLILFLYAVGMGVTAQISGRLYDTIGPRRPSVVGLILQIAVCLGYAWVGDSTSLILLTTLTLALGVGVALWNVPNNSAILGATPADSLGVGGAFTNVTRTIGTVLGQALAAGLVVAVMTSQGFDIPLADLTETLGADGAFLDGWRIAFLGATGFSAAGLAAAIGLPDR